ncbi:GGDEF domain-containing protein [Acidovorax sp. LjRoot194]|uniref:GGDEF domain-containing protein n=1 Tax=Acidovorax sp. LjRoot194 TaxID=3342280 RepID=UPI003ECE62F1
MQLSRLLQLLGALILLATVLLVGRVATTEWQSVRKATHSLHALDELQLGLRAVEMLSRERGPTNAALGDGLPAAPERLKALRDARERTDHALAQLQQSVAHAPYADDAAERQRRAVMALSRARAAVDDVLALPKAQRTHPMIRQAVNGMAAVVPLLAPLINASARSSLSAYPALGDEVHGASLAIHLRDQAGLLGSHFTAAIVTGQTFAVAERRAIDETRGGIERLRALLELRLQLHQASDPVVDAWGAVTMRYFGAAYALAEDVMARGERDGIYGLTAAQFAALYVPDMEPLPALRDVLLAQARHKASAEHARAVTTLLWVLAGATGLLLVLGGALVMIQRRVLQPLVKTTSALRALARDDLSAPLPVPLGDDEMAEVIGAVRSLQVQTQQRRDLERERDQLIEQLRLQSETDCLTGLPNRRAFLAAAQCMLAAASRHGFAVAVVMMDIDRFKQLNDNHGHAAGDTALRAVADGVRAMLREGDLAARFGGEEFVVLLGYCDSSHGVLFAERLRAAIAGAAVLLPAGPVQVTASLGVADSALAGLDLDALLSAADAAMYRAKQAGRDRVMVAAQCGQSAAA